MHALRKTLLCKPHAQHCSSSYSLLQSVILLRTTSSEDHRLHVPVLVWTCYTLSLACGHCSCNGVFMSLLKYSDTCKAAHAVHDIISVHEPTLNTTRQETNCKLILRLFAMERHMADDRNAPLQPYVF